MRLQGYVARTQGTRAVRRQPRPAPVRGGGRRTTRGQDGGDSGERGRGGSPRTGYSGKRPEGGSGRSREITTGAGDGVASRRVEGSWRHPDSAFLRHSGKQGLRAARQGQGAGPASSQPWQPLRGVRSRREGGAPRHGDLSGGRRHPSGSHFPMWSFPLLTRTWRLETDFSLGDKKHKKHLNESNIVFCFALVFFFVKNNEHIESSGAGFTVAPAAVALCAPVPADPPADPPLTRPLTHPLTGPLTRPLTRPSDAPTFPLVAPSRVTCRAKSGVTVFPRRRGCPWVGAG